MTTNKRDREHNTTTRGVNYKEFDLRFELDSKLPIWFDMWCGGIESPKARKFFAHKIPEMLADHFIFSFKSTDGAKDIGFITVDYTSLSRDLALAAFDYDHNREG